MGNRIKRLKRAGPCPDITILWLGSDTPRVCDYCNRQLVTPGGMVEDRCFVTEYGLMCRHCCLTGIPIICGCLPGEDVSEAAWYKGLGLYQAKHSRRYADRIPRLCGYCSRELIDSRGLVVAEAHVTTYDILCQYCIGLIHAVEVYQPGEDVSEQSWYTGFCL